MRCLALHPIFWLLSLFLLMLPQTPLAEEFGNPWTHSFYFENDLFNNTDSQYTNGVKYSIISPDLSPSARDYDQIPRRILDFIHQIPLINTAPPETSHKVEFNIGQNIYTPADISRRERIEDDRPYAGWLYFGTALHRKSDEGLLLSQMDTLEVQLGIIGPASFAEQSQDFVHRVRALDRPKGWDNQLRTEPGLLLAYERKWLLHPDRQGVNYDVIGHLGGAVGNVATYLNGGIEMRLGWRVPRSFGVSLIRPAGSAWLAEDAGFYAYVFGALNARYVMHSLFLDGNTWRNSQEVDRIPFVSDMLAGVAVGWDRLMLSFTQNVRTREFEEQDEAHSFGSIRLTFTALF